MKLEDLINTQYLETDTPELLIKESHNVKDIISYIIRELEEKDMLKKKFNKKDFINEMEKDFDFVSHLEIISENLLIHIRDSYGLLNIEDNRTNYNTNNLFKFNSSEVREMSRRY